MRNEACFPGFQQGTNSVLQLLERSWHPSDEGSIEPGRAQAHPRWNAQTGPGWPRRCKGLCPVTLPIL